MSSFEQPGIPNEIPSYPQSISMLGDPSVLNNPYMDDPDEEDLRDLSDIPSTRKAIFGSILNAAQNLKPVHNNKYTLTVSDVDYEPEKVYTPAEVKKAILERQSLNRKLQGTWNLIDTATGQTLEQRKTTLAQVPYLTDNGAFVLNGTKFTLKNQSRLLPAVYSRIKENGQIEAHVNALSHEGPTHRYGIDPETGAFSFVVSQSKTPLMGVLKAMGATDEELKDAWGEDIFKANAAKYTEADRHKLYEKLYRHSPGALSKEDTDAAISSALSKISFDPEVMEATLGRRYTHLTKDVILDTTKKLIGLSRNEIEPDDRDNLAFQEIYGPEDLFAERLTKDHSKLRRSLLSNLTFKNLNLKSIKSGALTGQLLAAIQSSGLGMSPEDINPSDAFDKQYSISRLGEGALPCHSEDTEVFTEQGWMNWGDVTEDIRLLTCTQGELRYEKPTKLYKNWHKGDMYRCDSEYISYLVTGNHRMYCAEEVESDGSSNPSDNVLSFNFESAENCHNKRRVHKLTMGMYKEKASVCQAFLDSFAETDDFRPAFATVDYFSESSQLRDRAAYLAVLSGLSVRYCDRIEENGDISYGVKVGTESEAVIMQPGSDDSYEIVDYAGYVYCAEVPGGMLLTRYNNKLLWSGNSIDSVPDDARDINNSQFSFIDPIRTPESLRAGVDLFLAGNVRKGKNNQIYSKVHDRMQNRDRWMSPKQLFNKTIAVATEFDNDEEFIPAFKRGKLGYVAKDEVEYILPDFEKSFSPLSNMIPAKSMSKGQRINMGTRFLGQALPLVDREAPLVQSATEDPEQSYEEKYSSFFGTVRSKNSGVVREVGEDFIKVQYDDGTTDTVNLSVNQPNNRKSVVGNTRIFIKRSDGFIWRGGIEFYKPEAGDMTRTIDNDTYRSGWSKVTGFSKFVNDKPLIKITTNKGRSVTVTEDHSLVVAGEDGYLTPIYPKDCKIGATRLPVAFLELNRDMDNAAYYRGFIAGSYLANETTFGGTEDFESYDKHHCWLTRCFGSRYANKYISNFVLSYSYSFRKGLVIGFMMSANWQHISKLASSEWKVSFKHKQLRDDFLDILDSLYIPTSVSQSSTLQENGLKDIAYELSISCYHLFNTNFLSTNIPGLEEEAFLVPQPPTTGGLVADQKAVRWLVRNSNYDFEDKHIDQHESYFLSSEKLKELAGGYSKWAGSDIRWETIVSMEEAFPQKFVYDLEVEGSNCFCVDHGLVVHNSQLTQYPEVRPGDRIQSNQILASSNVTKDGAVALGRNARVALIPWAGSNYEDAVVVSKSFADRMKSQHMYQHGNEWTADDSRGKKPFIGIFPTKFTRAQLDVMDDEGIIKRGTKVMTGDPLILSATKRQAGPRDRVRGKGARAFNDTSVTWDHHDPGIVTDVHSSPSGTTVLVATEAELQIGDKLCLSADTEVLTSKGWKDIRCVTLYDEVACLHLAMPGEKLSNRVGTVKYETPKAVHYYPEGGRMYRVVSEDIDLKVTDNHRMFVRLPDSKQDVELIPCTELDDRPCYYMTEVGLGDENHRGEIITKELPAGFKDGSSESYFIANYTDPVYGLTVSTGIFYVRRNGKAVWTGNSGRYGNKGVIAKIMPDDQMPQTKDGPIELAFNSLGINSRINPSQEIELLLAKIARKRGKPYKLQDFKFKDFSSFSEFALAEAKKYGVDPDEVLIDSETGRPIKNDDGTGVATGEMYVMKLHHSAESKGSARAFGRYTANDEPARGSKDGSKRSAMMHLNALISHGAYNTIRDIHKYRGQRNDDYWLSFMKGNNPTIQKVPMIYEKFFNELKASGINVVSDNDRFNVMAMTDNDVNALAGDREVKNSQTIKFGKHNESIKGGLFDPTIFGELGNRWGKVSLTTPILNPVMEEPARNLLGLTQAGLKNILLGKDQYKKYGTGAKAIQDALKDINLDSEIEATRQQMQNTRKTARDLAVRRMNYLKGAKDSGVNPSEWMLNFVPVLPFKFRPISEMSGSNVPLVADVNYLYKLLIDSNDVAKELKGHVGDTHEEDYSVYSAFKQITGLSDVSHPKLIQKNVRGLLSNVFGDGSSKFSTMQRSLLGVPVDLVGRSVIIPDPDLDLDSIGIPEESAWTLFKPFIIRNLARKGTSLMKASELWEKKDPQAKHELLEEMDKRYVIADRAPVLHKGGVMAFKSKLVPGDTLRLNTLVNAPYNADFDGDGQSGYVIYRVKQELTEQTITKNQEKGVDKGYRLS